MRAFLILAALSLACRAERAPQEQRVAADAPTDRWVSADAHLPCCAPARKDGLLERDVILGTIRDDACRCEDRADPTPELAGLPLCSGSQRLGCPTPDCALFPASRCAAEGATHPSPGAR